MYALALLFSLITLLPFPPATLAESPDANPPISNSTAENIWAIEHGYCEKLFRPWPNSCPALGYWTGGDTNPLDKMCRRNGCISYVVNHDPKYSTCKGSPSCTNPFYIHEHLCAPLNEIKCQCYEGWKFVDGECKQKVCPRRGEGDSPPEYLEGEKWEWNVIKGRVYAQCYRGRTDCYVDCERGYGTVDDGLVEVLWDLGV
ncbi:hypothetical protein B0T16DRAFT_455853 [Cercophora newfieldiana]|uniref:Uncharacterized protein n=1 Tax=Cercophora newfieldiana TaxID=92897 RepID=A0AA39Y991_9PEZI|nr:hypothetical protein B0T16DRAFT_455853 [Cercophora newfieldiana]